MKQVRGFWWGQPSPYESPGNLGALVSGNQETRAPQLLHARAIPLVMLPMILAVMALLASWS